MVEESPDAEDGPLKPTVPFGVVRIGRGAYGAVYFSVAVSNSNPSEALKQAREMYAKLELEFPAAKNPKAKKAEALSPT